MVRYLYESDFRVESLRAAGGSSEMIGLMLAKRALSGQIRSSEKDLGGADSVC